MVEWARLVRNPMRNGVHVREPLPAHSFEHEVERALVFNAAPYFATREKRVPTELTAG